ncbi:MAG: serine protease [Desulfobacula sp. GWF2_41_7]|nr:MAG: serine protease [Desulfobacula sp. GWF2_41_7]
MQPNKYLIFIITVFCLVFSCSWLRAVEGKPKIYVIPIEGAVEPGMAAYVKQSLKNLKDETDAVFIFKLDTFGGRVDSALDIVEEISGITRGKTIAYVEKRAISAGALIALASNLLVMKENTIIGDCAPIIQTEKGMEMAGEKVQTVLRARFRALAKKNNYPVVLAESMVTIDMEVYQVMAGEKKTFMDKKAYDDLTEDEKKAMGTKKTIVAKGELLTMDDDEAFDLGFSQKSVKDMNEALLFLGYGSMDIITIEESWSESLVRFLQPFLPMLMLIGIGAVYMEIKAPGFGLPGVIGIICIGLVIFNQYFVGLADYTELLILLIGILLLGVEVFVLPGFGVAGITGLICIAAGLVLSFQGFVIPDPELPWEADLLMDNLAYVLGSFLFAFFISLFMIRYVLPQFSKIIKGPCLDATLTQSHVDVTTALGIKPGDRGIAHSFLRPSGKVVINNKKIDAVTQGEFLEQGVEVIIDRIEPNRVIVKPIKTKNIKALE